MNWRNPIVELGSQAKMERARALRAVRMALYQYRGGRGSGRRYMTEQEIDEWYLKLGSILKVRRPVLRLVKGDE